jgi:hypothetical protein
LAKEERRLSCPVCGRELLIYCPNGEVRKSACTCGHVLFVERDVVEIPLAKALEPHIDAAVLRQRFGAPLVGRPATRACGAAIDLFVGAVRQLVLAQPSVAASAVWWFLVETERAAQTERRSQESAHEQQMRRLQAVARATQVLLGCLFEIGQPIPVPQEQSGETGVFISKCSFIASDIGPVTSAYENLRSGLVEGELRNGILLLRKTSLHTRMAEWHYAKSQIDAREGARGWRFRDGLFNHASARAQEWLLGFSGKDVASLLDGGRHGPLRHLESAHTGAVYLLRARSCPEITRRLFESISLTSDRVRTFRAPFYWDLGDRDDVAQPEPLARRLSERNWLNYYPVVPCVHNQEKYFQVSAELLALFATHLDTFKNRLLERMRDRMLTENHPFLKEVDLLRAEANRSFERAVADAFVELGFSVRTNMSNAGQHELKGGEIDLLAARRTARGTQVVLAEVKDFDLKMHRPAEGLAMLTRKVRDADKQIDRKTADVRRLWSAIRPELGVDLATPQGERVELWPMLVTSEYLPSPARGSHLVVSLNEASDVLHAIKLDADAFSPRLRPLILVP